MKKTPLTEEMLVFNGDELDIELDGIRGKCRRGAFSIPYGDRLGFKLCQEFPNGPLSSMPFKSKHSFGEILGFEFSSRNLINRATESESKSSTIIFFMCEFIALLLPRGNCANREFLI